MYVYMTQRPAPPHARRHARPPGCGEAHAGGPRQRARQTAFTLAFTSDATELHTSPHESIL